MPVLRLSKGTVFRVLGSRLQALGFGLYSSWVGVMLRWSLGFMVQVSVRHRLTVENVYRAGRWQSEAGEKAQLSREKGRKVAEVGGC